MAHRRIYKEAESDLPVYDAHLSFYFNGEFIYEYDDLLRTSPGDAEYIDLNSDGEPEIFLHLSLMLTPHR